jgi:hypothetical protein
VVEFGNSLWNLTKNRPNQQYAEKKTTEEKQVVGFLDSAPGKGSNLHEHYFRATVGLTFLAAQGNTEQAQHLMKPDSLRARQKSGMDRIPHVCMLFGSDTSGSYKKFRMRGS